MIFSLLCPTRKRVESVKRLLNSLRDTCLDSLCFEVLFAYDFDDERTAFALSQFVKEFKELNIVLYGRDHSHMLNEDYHNWLAHKAKGDYLWVIGDDVVFKTWHWDEVLWRYIREFEGRYRDRIMLIGVDDSTPPPKGRPKDFSCFPIISRKAFEVTGFFFPGRIPTWGADTVVADIYRPVNRLLFVPEVKLLHVSHHTDGSVPRDETSYGIEIAFRQQGAQPITLSESVDVPAAISKIKAYIREVNGGVE